MLIQQVHMLLEIANLSCYFWLYITLVDDLIALTNGYFYEFDWILKSAFFWKKVITWEDVAKPILILNRLGFLGWRD